MSERKIFPWGGQELSDEEYEDSSVIETLILIYGLGYAYSSKKFKIFNMPYFCTEQMSIKETLNFLLEFEERYKDEVWFQHGKYESRRKAMVRKLQGGA